MMFYSADDINPKIESRTDQLLKELKAEMSSLGMVHDKKDPLFRIGRRYNKEKEFNMINRIRLRFKRSGVFVHKGVGRPKKDGSPSSRQPKEWFNPLVEKYADDLADTMADHLVEATFDRLKIR